MFGFVTLTSPQIPSFRGLTRCADPCSRKPRIWHRQVEVRSQVGFGQKNPNRGVPGKKSPRTIRATYLELVQRGSKEYTAFVREQGTGDTGWRRVGTIVAEDDKCCIALHNHKRVVLEHAKRLYNQFALKKVLEVGYGSEEENAAPPTVCQRTDLSCTSAFAPDAVPSGSFYKPVIDQKRANPQSSGGPKSPPGSYKPRVRGEGKTPEQ